MHVQFANVAVFLTLASAFVLLLNLLSRLVHLRLDLAEKRIPYECGEDPVDDARIKFNIRFFIVALIFLIFDVEIAFLFPWARVFRQVGWIAFVEMFVFILMLAVGLAYVWAKGDLEWVRSYHRRHSERIARVVGHREHPEEEAAG
ncbi:MAG: hypothetical protein KatS3mg115_0295 [Candidatus Poribacteria bacterium]|nr:MAG: hypothetical protein KatS3mg115_0295 [Candidatus Poribacteria bacterium]